MHVEFMGAALKTPFPPMVTEARAIFYDPLPGRGNGFVAGKAQSRRGRVL